MSSDEAQRQPVDPLDQQWDEAANDLERMPASKRHMLYQILHNGYGCRINDASREARKAWRVEHPSWKESKS